MIISKIDKVGFTAGLHQKRLPSSSSIFSAEVIAIDLDLDIKRDNEPDNFIIFSDSLSVITSSRNKHIDNHLIVKLLICININLDHYQTGLILSGSISIWIIFISMNKTCFLLGRHIGIRGKLIEQ